MGSTDRGRGRVPWGFLGMLGLMALVELVLARHGLAPSNWRASGHAARERAAKCEVLCFGDSQVKLGLLPRVIEKHLGRPAYNLAVVGGQAPASYFLLRRALEAGARPKAVLVDFFPDLLLASPWFSAPLWPELVSTQECFDLCWAAGEPGLFVKTTLRRLPSYAARDAIRRRVVATLRDRSDPELDREWVFRRNWRHNRGALVRPRNPEFVDEAERLKSRVHNPRWECHPVNRAYVRRFLALAAHHDIHVFWLLPPSSPAWQAGRDRLGLDGPYLEFVTAMQAQFPELVVLDARHSGYDRRVFHDSTHLDRRGAAVLSAEVAEVVARRLTGAGPRWVRLPDFRDRPIDAPLEDLEQSRLALEGAKEGRR